MELLLIVCLGGVVVGLVMVGSGFKVARREPPGLPPAQIVIDGKHDLGRSSAPRIRVRDDRLVRGIAIIAVALIAGVATVNYLVQHMTFDFSGSWFPGN
jgi:hypothetical protein